MECDSLITLGKIHRDKKRVFSVAAEVGEMVRVGGKYGDAASTQSGQLLSEHQEFFDARQNRAGAGFLALDAELSRPRRYGQPWLDVIGSESGVRRRLAPWHGYPLGVPAESEAGRA